MALSFENISYQYAGEPALVDINLSANAGEILCLLGPSGCGKTTLLNLATGILRMQSGKITLDDQPFATPQNCPPPEKRNVGLVFQDGALFPHMSAADNIAFGLKHKEAHKGMDKGAGRADVAAWLGKVGLAGLEDRYPHTLSGGQQQRVAVARALAPKPPILLMDEPFANIDIAMRRSLREDIRLLLKAQKTVSIIVTHDPEEAMEMGDKIAVMDQGKIIQSGSPSEIYKAPASLEVARLTSSGAHVKARLSDGQLITDWGRWPLSCLAGPSDNLPDTLDLFLRRDAVKLSTARAADAGYEIIDVRHSGLMQIIMLGGPDGITLRLQLGPEPERRVGERVTLTPQTGHVISF